MLSLPLYLKDIMLIRFNHAFYFIIYADTTESRMEKEGNWSVYWMVVIYNTVLLNWLWIIIYTGIVFVNKLVWIFSLGFIILAHCSTWVYPLINQNNTFCHKLWPGINVLLPDLQPDFLVTTTFCAYWGPQTKQDANLTVSFQIS